MKNFLKTASSVLCIPSIALLVVLLFTVPGKLDSVKASAYDEGYTTASATLDQEKAASYDEGYKAGYDVGCAEAADSAYDDGHSDGYGEGYDDGYADAKAKYQSTSSASSTSSSASSTASSTQSTTVYVTNTGTKYHKSWCSYLRKSKIPISLSDAKSYGYTACSRCF